MSVEGGLSVHGYSPDAEKAWKMRFREPNYCIYVYFFIWNIDKIAIFWWRLYRFLSEIIAAEIIEYIAAMYKVSAARLRLENGFFKKLLKAVCFVCSSSC